jgi:predicted aspartyl protease
MNPSIYSVRRTGNLFIVKASIGRFNAPPSVLQLLIDTGATQTSLPIEFLKDIGCSIDSQTPRRSILTGNGTINAAIVPIPWLNCLGQRLEDFPVLALQIPVSRYINGILGMDFLTRFQAIIDIGKGQITLP